MRMNLRGDQPTIGDYVRIQGEWWKLVSQSSQHKIATNWKAVNAKGGRRTIGLYSDQGYVCWTSRVCSECNYLGVHSVSCPKG